MIKAFFPVRPPAGNGLSAQCKKIRKERKGKKKRNYSAKGEGVDVRGLTAKERMSLNMVLRGWE